MIDFNEGMRTGWICPKCGRVLAPTMGECYYCNSEKTATKDTPEPSVSDTVVSMAPAPTTVEITKTSETEIGEFTIEVDDEDEYWDYIMRIYDKDGNLITEASSVAETKTEENVKNNEENCYKEIDALLKRLFDI